MARCQQIESGALDTQSGFCEILLGALDDFVLMGGWVVDEDEFTGPGFVGDPSGVLWGGVQDPLARHKVGVRVG